MTTAPLTEHKCSSAAEIPFGGGRSVCARYQDTCEKRSIKKLRDVRSFDQTWRDVGPTIDFRLLLAQSKDAISDSRCVVKSENIYENLKICYSTKFCNSKFYVNLWQGILYSSYPWENRNACAGYVPCKIIVSGSWATRGHFWADTIRPFPSLQNSHIFWFP